MYLCRVLQLPRKRDLHLDSGFLISIDKFVLGLHKGVKKLLFASDHFDLIVPYLNIMRGFTDGTGLSNVGNYTCLKNSDEGI
jgi:hypothetical protein